MSNLSNEEEKYQISKDFKDRFSELISELIFDLKCKRVDVPNIIGVHKDTIRKALNFGIIPSPKSLIKIADYFNISIEYLLNRTDDIYFEKADNSTNFQARFEELKESESMKTGKIARATKIPDSYFTIWRKESYTPTLEFLIPLSLFFGVSIDYLLGRTDDKEINLKAEYKLKD